MIVLLRMEIKLKPTLILHHEDERERDTHRERESTLQAKKLINNSHRICADGCNGVYGERTNTIKQIN
jgi:hypothetical protein